MKTQFPNVSFLAKQILGILGSQIKIEHVFTHCKLRVDNLDSIIIVMNNWLDIPHLDCSRHKKLKDFLKVESSLAKNNI
jgi:hypothetical protein